MQATPFPSLTSSLRSCSCRCGSLGACGEWPGAGAASQPAVAAAVAAAEGDWAVSDVGALAPQLAGKAAVPYHQWRLRVLAPLHPACMWQITTWLEPWHASNVNRLEASVYTWLHMESGAVLGFLRLLWTLQTPQHKLPLHQTTEQEKSADPIFMVM
jgi:hypothetical protein